MQAFEVGSYTTGGAQRRGALLEAPLSVALFEKEVVLEQGSTRVPTDNGLLPYFNKKNSIYTPYAYVVYTCIQPPCTHCLRYKIKKVPLGRDPLELVN
jgi:hypothetical protein